MAMHLAKIRLPSGEVRVGVTEGDRVWATPPGTNLNDVLSAAQPGARLRELTKDAPELRAGQVSFLPPLDEQEVWAAGVTYKRSKEAREEESKGASRFYHLVYSAPRPELFFKAPAWRVRGHGDSVRIRRDSKWNVPEPELALVISPSLKLAGFTIGNDMSSRDIEGENPLYLPQAKVYDHSCAIGPVITLIEDMPAWADVTIRLIVERQGETAFEGATTLASMKRTPEELISWLGRETSFPHGAVLLTGTGVVPPDDFTLMAGDFVHIDIAGIGRLTNRVEQKA